MSQNSQEKKSTDKESKSEKDSPEAAKGKTKSTAEEGGKPEEGKPKPKVEAEADLEKPLDQIDFEGVKYPLKEMFMRFLQHSDSIE